MPKLPDPTPVNVELFERRCVALRLSRLATCGLDQDPRGYRQVPSNVAIARRLHVSARAVSRARAGLPMPDSFIRAAVAALGVTRDELVDTGKRAC
jgi:hypothetical protein